MTRPKRSAVLGLISVLVLTCLLAWGLSVYLSTFSALPDAIKAAFIAMIAGAIGWLANRLAARMDAAALAHRKKKIAIYSRFAKAVLSGFLVQQPKGEESPPDLVDEMIRFQQETLFWGSPRVVRAYIALREDPTDIRKTAVGINKLFMAMRADIGLSNWGLGSNDLMKMMVKEVNDYDDWIAGRSKTLGTGSSDKPPS